MFTTLLNFCSNDLSAFYFDIRKDVIYCDSLNSHSRKSTRTLLNIIFNFLVRWFAPSLSFTTEEAWKAMGNTDSIHLEDFKECKKSYSNENLNKKWLLVKNIRKVTTGAIEKVREDKLIRSSLEAHIDIFLSEEILNIVKDVSFDEISITSSFKLNYISDETKGFCLDEISNVIVNVSKADGEKCQRCWKYDRQLINNEICNRCQKAIS
tara:strand:- start:149 stop:775 length:627 start_codon:yes stop_codon:yes gene_type:complete